MSYNQTMRELFTKEYGRFKVVAKTVIDEDPGSDMIGGHYTRYRDIDWKQLDAYPVYSVRDDAVLLPGKGDFWQNRRGQIVSLPETDSEYGNFLRFILVTDWWKDETKPLKLAFTLADRIKSYNNNGWWFEGIIATVYLNGVEIGEQACWGFNSDMQQSEFMSEARSFAHDAIKEAREWMAAAQIASRN